MRNVSIATRIDEVAHVRMVSAPTDVQCNASTTNMKYRDDNIVAIDQMQKHQATVKSEMRANDGTCGSVGNATSTILPNGGDSKLMAQANSADSLCYQMVLTVLV